MWSDAEKHLQDLKVALDEGADVTKTKAMREIQLHAYILEVEILGRLGRFDQIQKALEASPCGILIQTGSNCVHNRQSIQPETIPIQVCEAVSDLSVSCSFPLCRP